MESTKNAIDDALNHLLVNAQPLSTTKNCHPWPVGCTLQAVQDVHNRNQARIEQHVNQPYEYDAKQ
mgnify:CR=1 FL=1